MYKLLNMQQRLIFACCLLLVNRVLSNMEDAYYEPFVPDLEGDPFSEEVRNIRDKIPCFRECLSKDTCKFVAFKEGCKKDCCFLCLNGGSPVSTLRSGFEYWKDDKPQLTTETPEMTTETPQMTTEAQQIALSSASSTYMYTEYLFAMTRAFQGSTKSKATLTAFSHVSTSLTVTIGSSSPTSYSLDAGVPKYIDIVGSHRLAQTSSVENKGISVHAEQPIKLLLFDQKTDYVLPIPTFALGTDYLAAGYSGTSGNSDLNSMLAMVALHDNTQITGKRGLNPQFTRTLNARQTFTYLMSDDDVTGLQITSDKPISVLSGGDCLFVPLGNKFCDPISSQILPRNRWGQNYVVVSKPHHTCGMLLRVMATDSNTHVDLSNGQDTTINTGEHWEYNLASGVGVTVGCSHKCLVWLINKSNCNDVTSNPYQIMVPAINMWPTVPVQVPYDTDTTVASRYLTIMALTTESSQLTLNGNTISGWNNIADSTYSWAHVTITTANNILDHPSSNVKVMAFMTAQAGFVEWGAPIGIVLE